MELAWKELEFWNQMQRLIVKWLDEDYNQIAKVAYVKKMSNKTPEQIKLVSDIEIIEEDSRKTIDKYIKSLNNIKIQDIVDKIIEPILEKKKSIYEKNFNEVLYAKRQEALEKMKKKYKHIPPEKLVLDF